MSGKPVVAMCSVGELFGGVERHLLGMCEWFRRQGTEPILILFHDNELASQARAMGFEPLVLDSSSSFDLTVPKKLAALLRERKVDLLHAHGYRAMVNAALARRHYQFEVVRTVHGLIEPSSRFSLPWIKSRLYSWMEKTASIRMGATVCYVTDDLRKRRSEGDGGRVSLTVHNGIDPVSKSDFKRPEDLPEGVFHFAAVGRVSPVKGLETALRAMKELDPEVGAVLDIIGSGPSMDLLKELAEELQLGQRVCFLGFKENIYDYLAHVDVLIMPSLHEGLPYTILETMSLGTPIIASRVGGLAEILEDGRTALLVEAGDVGGWAEAMLDLAGNRQRALELGAAGKVEQARALTLETMGADYWGVYLQKVGQ